jgi:hypothetical protein
MSHLIQTDGIIKEYKPEDLPNGCVISGTTKLCKGMVFGLKEGSCITAYPYQIDDYKKEYELDVWGLHAINDIKIHDIINPETGESTHVKRWSAVDRDGYVFIYYEKPKRLNEGNSGTWDGPRQLSDEYILYPSNGQTWEDEPRPVWIEIPKEN